MRRPRKDNSAAPGCQGEQDIARLSIAGRGASGAVFLQALRAVRAGVICVTLLYPEAYFDYAPKANPR